MERFDPKSVAHTILDAPAWAKIGITAPSERLREEAALELARCVTGEDDRPDSRQLALF